MNTRDEAWNTKIDSLSAMFPDHARTVLESILVINVGDIENAANQLIDVNITGSDVNGLIEDQEAILANIKMETDQQPATGAPLTPNIAPTASTTTPNNAPQASTNNNIAPSANTTGTSTTGTSTTGTSTTTSSSSSSSSSNYSRNEKSQPFLLQYKLGNERDRATFLDVFQSFWSGQGYPRNTIPVVDFVNGINFDLYRMYHAVVREGGYDRMRTADNGRWEDLILRALKLNVDKQALKLVKSSYDEHLYPFEKYYCGTTDFSSIAIPQNQTDGGQIPASATSQSDGQIPTNNLNRADSCSAAPPRNKHKTVKLSGSSSAVPDSTTSNIPPVLDSAGSSSNLLLPANIPSNTPANIPASNTTQNNIPPKNIPASNTLQNNIPANVPPTMQLSTAGIFQQHGNGSVTGTYPANNLLNQNVFGIATSELDQYVGVGKNLVNQSVPNSELDQYVKFPDRNVLDQYVGKNGVEDAFMDVENHLNQSFMDGDHMDDSRSDSTVPEDPEHEVSKEILAVRRKVEENLMNAEKELKEAKIRFNLEVMKDTDSEYDRLTDKAKIFFSTFSNSTIEIMEMYRVNCPQNKVFFHEKAAILAFEAITNEANKTVELYRSCHQIQSHNLSENKIYSILTDYYSRLFSLYKYAHHETEGNVTFVVCDVLIGKKIPLSDSNEGPVAFQVCYKNMIKLKYVINLRATKIASLRRANPYSDIPDCMAHLTDGVRQIDIRTFDFRNASDPWTDVVMRATSLYNGDCIKRNAHHIPRYGHKKDIAQLGIVISHSIWKKYEAKRANLASNSGKEIYAYHATPPQNVESIARSNLDWRRHPLHGRAHGNGCYFSEYPELSLKYNKHCMFIFKLILLPNQYKRVAPDRQGFCEQIIMWDDSLFKPVYVLYF